MGTRVVNIPNMIHPALCFITKNEKCVASLLQFFEQAKRNGRMKEIKKVSSMSNKSIHLS